MTSAGRRAAPPGGGDPALVQRIPVKIVLDQKAGNPHTLRAGMSAFVTIDLE